MLSLLAMLLTAAPSNAPRLVVLDLQRVGQVSDAEAGILNDAIVQVLSKNEVFQVVSQRDINTLLGVERQKQLMGCGESSCFAEISGALDARFVLSGQLTKLGNTFQLTLQMLDTQKSQPVGRSLKVAKTATELRAMLPWALADAAGTPPPKPPSRLWPTVMLVTGGLSAAAGGIGGFVALSKEFAILREFRTGATDPGILRTASEYVAEAEDLRSQKTASLLFLSIGAALVAGGLWWWFSLPDVAGGVSLVPTGSGVAVVGSFR